MPATLKPLSRPRERGWGEGSFRFAPSLAPKAEGRVGEG